MRHAMLSVWVAAAVLFLSSGNVAAHCEIPCGIYNDSLRADLIEEHAGTIRKSMETIISLQKAKPINYNQLVRWVANKDDHAEKVQEIVWQYFMTQRIKPTDVQYGPKLGALHAMLIYAMKCKQTTDVANVKGLLDALERFKKLYFKEQTSGESYPHKKNPVKGKPKKK